jgi:hypothetical protein
MLFKTAIANCLWTASNAPAYLRFHRALRKPRVAQQRKLRELITQNTNTAFGKTHRFGEIRTYEDFTRRVPLNDYSAFEPWIERIRRGEENVLTSELVTHLVPTSGSSGARKLIPFTAGLQREFSAAIGPWLADLTLHWPGVLGGPAYWSISPAIGEQTAESSAVPIGFASDTEYLGGKRRRLAEMIMAVPPNVSGAKSLEAFRYETLLHLVRCRELRLISVWHPSFLTLLLDALPTIWERVQNEIGARRANELKRIDPWKPEAIWPQLRVISCWGDGAARLALDDLRKRFPSVGVQPKGLIATEAFVSLPFKEQYPLAVASHFFEFINPQGEAIPLEEVVKGDEYEIVVTTAGGLWRYRVGDTVRVTGWLEKTPCLEFLGRKGNVSDCFGEKLSEPFVAQAFAEVFGNKLPRFALLAPDEDKQGCRYTLYLEGQPELPRLNGLERALRRNPHYAYCRDLGQLLPPRFFMISAGGFESFAARQAAHGARLGNVKPALLSRSSGWSKVFLGAYVDLGISRLPEWEEPILTEPHCP